jgi:purine-binding chemotaxis protein CheW
VNALTSIVAAAERRPDDPVLPDSAVHVGLVRLCGRDLAVPAADVREVVPLPDRLQPAFTDAAALAGSIIVRGQVIPVVDVAPLLGFEDHEPGPGVVVVLRRDRDLIGLFVHAVSGLTSVRAGDIQPYLFAGTESTHVVTSCFALDDRLAGVVDISAILALPGVPRVREVSRVERDILLVGQTRLLVLSVAGADLALEATFVVATVPGTQVRAAPGVGNQWVGVVDYLDMEVPVIDDIALLGLSGRAGNGLGTLVVIVRLGEDRLLGIKADHVHRIMSVHARDICPFPGAMAAGLPLFTGAVANGGGGQSLLLSSAALAEDKALGMIAALTHRKLGAGTGEPSRISGRRMQDRSGGQRSYLVFRTGVRRRACALSDISQIIPLPRDHRPVAAAASPLCGFISHAGKPVALVDLGSGTPDGGRVDTRMILIVAGAECATGFIVDQLDTIVRAVAQDMPSRATEKRGDKGGDKGGGAHFIEARLAGGDEAVPVCRLEDEVDRRITGISNSRE